MPSPSERARLDPYTSQAENKSVTLSEKINDLCTIIKVAKTGMLVTRNAEGNLHSRAMNPVNSLGEGQLNLVFLANNVSAKFEEIENDSHVNVSFFDSSTTSWVSYAGRARVSQDRDVICKHWSMSVTGYIGNLQDGVHTGDENDPRVSVIEVVPDEIRYWYTEKGAVPRTLEVAAGAVTGKATSPGELHTITKEEIQFLTPHKE
ncbi:hypothetical protein BKA82DRAFT_254449 [Pisolithus tinctorius]|uniref:General stress protein FMN-binding split barrel domain-containing protein n=1 Tax=Pisolithus tinctorius Marx 270 TaxID=870435 RepID=A0A0C3NLM5_PISTI|nr:hypothetical protein BKA82DRAFT_254449 [Pisolithus tinctorius]KIN96208.1 hypothetical protein M404DRAFT_254449 [Pisolithus tinctorius Marx 270]